MEKERIVIVNEGTWCLVSEKTYESSVKIILEALEADERIETIEEVDTVEDALEKLRMFNVDILIFRSRSMILPAKRIKEKYPKVKVIILTGFIPESEIIWVSKSWIAASGLEILKTIVFC